MGENTCIDDLVELMLEWDEGGGVDCLRRILFSDSIVRAQDKRRDCQVRMVEITYSYTILAYVLDTVYLKNNAYHRYCNSQQIVG